MQFFIYADGKPRGTVIVKESGILALFIKTKLWKAYAQKIGFEEVGENVKEIQIDEVWHFLGSKKQIMDLESNGPL